jgi:hypothetical protein
LPVPGADEQVVEHFIIGQQDVGRRPTHGVAVGDDTVAVHQPARSRDAGVAADKQANAQPLEGRHAGDEAGKAPRLVHS